MRRNNRNGNLTPQEAKDLLDAMHPQEEEDTDAVAAAYFKVQTEMIHGPHSQELAETHDQSFIPGPEGDVAFQRHLEILRLIVQETAPELLDQLREEIEDGRFDAKRDAIRKRTPDDQSS